MIAIVGGKVYTMQGQVLDPGTVVLEQGKIRAVGSDISVPEQATVVNVQGKFVFPGFIDAHCHVGIIEEIYQTEGDDANEITDPIMPHLRAIDGINPEDLGFADAVAGGITTVCVTPGSANVIGGEMVAMKTHGTIVDQMVIKSPVGLKVAFGENPKRVYGNQKKAPYTRMATAGLLREAFTKAGNYLRKHQHGISEPGNIPDTDLRMEILVSALKREIPVRAHAHRADDIATAVRIAEEFGLRLVIEHCTEGHKIADFLAAKGIPAVVGPNISTRAKVELKDRDLRTPAVLAQAGVPVALMTDHPVLPIQHLLLCAGLAMREGFTEQQALEAITIQGARVLGLEDRVGSIAVGKDADLVILDGHPLDLQTKVEKVFVNGNQVFSV